MAGVTNIIELGFNVQDLTEQKQQVLTVLLDMFEQIKQYDGTRINPINLGGVAELRGAIQQQTIILEEIRGGFDKYNKILSDNIAQQARVAQAINDNVSSNNKNKTSIDEITKYTEKLTKAQSDEAKAVAELKVQIAAQNAENKNTAIINTAAADSLVQLQAKLKAAQASYDGMDAAIRDNTEAGVKAKAKVVELTAAVSALEQSTGRHQRSVGNYTGALKPLEALMAQLKAKIDAVTSSGVANDEVLAKLNHSYTAVASIVSTTSAGFTSVTQEIRQSEKALQTLNAAGLGGTEEFKKLQQEVANAKREFNEFAKGQKIMESQAPVLTALTSAAKGLSGAYAVGAGASALFADGNEKVEKELAKLMAIMTFIQGLNEVHALLQEKNTILTVIQTAATATLTKAKQMLGLANIEQAETAEVAAGAMEMETVATEAATGATFGLADAIVMTGIGAIIIALVWGVSKLVGVVGNWVNADEKAIEKNKELASISKELNEILKAQSEIVSEDAQKIINMYENQLNKAKAIGSNQIQQFAIEKKLNDAKLFQADQVIDKLGITHDKVFDLSATYIEQQGWLERLLESEAKYIKNGEKVPEKLKKQIEAQKEMSSSTKTLWEEGKKALEDKDKAEKAIEVQKLTEDKYNADEFRKLTLETAKIEANSVIEKNTLILNNERSTLAQRVSALKSNAAENKAIAKAEYDAIKSDPTQSDDSKKIALLKYQADRKKITNEARANELKVIETYNQRELAAHLSINDALISIQKKMYDTIASDNKNSLELRISALQSSVNDEKQILQNELEFKIQQAKVQGKTDTEIMAIRTENAAKLQELTEATGKKVYDITISWGEKTAKDLAEQKTNAAATKTTQNYDAELSKLNEGLAKQKISYSKYLIERKKLDDKYLTDKDSADIADDQAELDRLKKHGEEIAAQKKQAEAELGNAQGNDDPEAVIKAQQSLSALLQLEKTNNKLIADEDKKAADDKKKLEEDTAKKILEIRKVLKQKEDQLAKESYALATEMVDAKFENEKNAIQNQINLSNAMYDNELKNIANSTLSNRQKAEQTIVLNSQKAQAEKQLQKEQKDADIAKAKFDRDAAIAEVTWQTARAIMKDTAGVPWPLSLEVGLADAALGAVQVAAILAKQIPKYAEGTDSHPGGYALVGEGKYAEWVQTPSGGFMIDKPTLLDLPATTSVTPLTNNTINEIVLNNMVKSNEVNENKTQTVNPWEVARWQTAQLKAAFNKSQTVRVRNTVIIDGREQEWINKKILGR